MKKIIKLLKKIIKHLKWCANNIKDYFKFTKTVNENSCVFISHNADSSGGAPVVLVELIKTLKNEDNIIFLSEKPGELINTCKNENIHSYTYGFMRKIFIKKILKKHVKYLLINTVACYKVINDINSKKLEIPVFLWVHEEDRLIKKYGNLMPNKLNTKIKILAVSERVKDSIQKYLPQYENINIMYYGCKDLYEPNNEEQNREKFIISVIGRICERKNQNQVIEAYEMLDSKIKSEIEIHFIAGSYEENYYNKFYKKIENFDNLKYIGQIKREEMANIYKKSSLVICSSIDDPLPVVITEAMMLYCPYITSSGTGQYSSVKHGINGFGYNVNSTKELAKTIEEVFLCKNISEVSKNARKLYEKNYTPESVREKFIDYLKS